MLQNNAKVTLYLYFDSQESEFRQLIENQSYFLFYKNVPPDLREEQLIQLRDNIIKLDFLRRTYKDLMSLF